MNNIYELPMNVKKGNLELTKMYVAKDFTAAYIKIPEKVDVFQNEALREYLLCIKSELESQNFKAIFFILQKKEKCFVYLIDTYQRYVCVVNDLNQFFSRYLAIKENPKTRENNQILQLIKAMNKKEDEL